jgi:predicted enzyme related to lactoylglutathione lyase
MGDKQTTEKNYFCHIVIPSKNYQKSKIFFEKIFGWKVQEVPGTNTLDVLPPSEKGPSAELNSEEDIIVPSISTSNIDTKLKLIEEFGGKILEDTAPIGENAEYGHYALFEDPQGNKMCLYSEK